MSCRACWCARAAVGWDMKLITLNIWEGKLKKPLLGFFEKYSDRVDIFCLQEVFEYGTIPRLTGQQDERGTFHEIQGRLPAHTGHFHPSQSNGEGLAIFVRRDIHLKDVNDVFVYR